MVWFIIAGNKMKYAVQTYSVESVFIKLLLLAVSPHDAKTSIAIIGEPNLRLLLIKESLLGLGQEHDSQEENVLHVV